MKAAVRAAGMARGLLELLLPEPRGSGSRVGVPASAGEASAAAAAAAAPALAGSFPGEGVPGKSISVAESGESIAGLLVEGARKGTGEARRVDW